MMHLPPQLMRGFGYAMILLIPTWLFFAPIAAFHHMVRCGLLCPVFLDGESPRSGVPLFLGEYDVHVFPGRLAISFVLWAICVFLGWRFTKGGVKHSDMSGIPDTLIELKAGESEAEGRTQVQIDIASMYPPESVPRFELSGVVERDGRRFVRLLSMAGSLHLLLVRWREAGQFPRPILFTPAKESVSYEYVA